MTRAFAITALLALAAGDLHAQARPDYAVTRAAQPPKIDGVLDDEVWKQAPLPTGEWVSYNPLRGDKMAPTCAPKSGSPTTTATSISPSTVSTPSPTRSARRSAAATRAFSDDWIAMSLDSAGTGQTAYHLFVNPSGIQMDALNTSASGEQFDADLVWDSAGEGHRRRLRRRDAGCRCRRIRFSGGDEVRMGILFFRKISRTGVSYSWPEMPPGQWVFDRPAHLLFDNLKQPRLFELLPSVTYGVSQTARPPDRWDPADDKADVGLSGKFGITSNITLDATINPDFSQVESDAFQVQVNQRFPIFFSEKRPFFMEGMGLFNIAGTGGDGNMRTAVHTRRIIDPFWGSKLTGTAGKMTFGVLNASDETSGGHRRPRRRHRRRTQQAVHDRPRDLRAAASRTTSARIFTDTEHAGRHNRVVGGDLSIKFSTPQQLSATFLRIADRRSHRAATRSGSGVAGRPTATTPAGSPGRTRSSTTTAISRWTRRSTTAPASRRDGRSAR